MIALFRSLNRTLILTLLVLIFFGSTMLYSASSAHRKGGLEVGLQELSDRVFHVMIGLSVLVLLVVIDYQVLRKLALAGFLLGVFLLVMVLFTKGIRGTRGWLSLLGFSLQAAELARLAMLIFMAKLLADREEEGSHWKRLRLPLLVLFLVPALVIFQPDFGSAFAIGLSGLLLLLAARLPRRWLLALLLGGLFIAGTGYQASERIRERIDWTYRVDPTELRDETYQLGQSLIGFGAGGVRGRGPGASRQKVFFLPDHHTDFIYSIVGEELGLMGSLSTLFLLVFLSTRMLQIARRHTEPFGRYLASGMASMVFAYTFLNMAVALGLFPLTGLPLPFFSHGGSALIMNMAAVGICLSVDRQQKKPDRRSPGKVSGELEDLFQRGSS
ncbi:MAG: FtsW/RodA/SpoVE family cell cycle protein [Candidatus Krumholzibacteria bacterium]|jgi:cell division protein FtsW|nr:FtsW/RodA/SpoVE family cell cycle protein [Candidatus Krumholzibacteria bacterium]MDP6669420.1 FtsW/RodA/SpoVE family cell cycle protein [Candidatus Krumholzibacteria bacterium]MDP6797884.1 FtsW/RodA/SpoVE family cell cycle protein [Candidatus Krumholzibacteria bacterium]MDP7021617.1 FtsW/RodA/SpoVE family cell cycle protein [Candidatus Krumholzibacteria bacterium]